MVLMVTVGTGGVSLSRFCQPLRTNVTRADCLGMSGMRIVCKHSVGAGTLGATGVTPSER